MLACLPTASGYGSAAAELLNALHLARALGVRAFFVKPRHPLNHAIFEVVSPEVTVIPRGGCRAIVLRAEWYLRHAWPDIRARVRTKLLLLGKQALSRPGRPKQQRQTIKRCMARISAWPSGPGVPPALSRALALIDFRREYAERSVRVELPARLSATARREALRAGIDPDKPLVTVHVRESGYKVSLGLPERPTDIMRNATIARYGPALRYLIEQGFQVVRVGDPNASPVEEEGVIDLARSPLRTEPLELWCLKQSQFFLASDSGPYMVALLLNTPTLAVNVTALVGGDPLRTGDLYLLKHVIDARSGRELSGRELLTSEYLVHFRARERYRHEENTADEIRQAVIEMVARQRQLQPPTPGQSWFREGLQSLMGGADVAAWRGSAGLPPLYVGDGLLADVAARRWFAERDA